MKRPLFYLLPLALFCTCSKPEASLSPEEEIIFGETQVYNDRHVNKEEVPFFGTCDVAGEPVMVFPSEQIPSSTSTPPVYPWTISGKINKGEMEISFPDNDYNLDSKYEGAFSEGVRIAQVFVVQKDARSRHLALHKWDKNVCGRIYIYYADKEFSKFNDGTITLKKGWNYVEFINDYDQNIFWKQGKISQDINDFIKEGYRWTIEIWT